MMGDSQSKPVVTPFHLVEAKQDCMVGMAKVVCEVSFIARKTYVLINQNAMFINLQSDVKVCDEVGFPTSAEFRSQSSADCRCKVRGEWYRYRISAE